MLYGWSRGAPPISSNIKVGKVGGIVKAKRIAAIADAASLPIVMSGNLELGHGIAASAPVAASLSGARHATDIFVGGHKHDSDLIKEDWDKEGMTIRVPTGAGLGVCLKDEFSTPIQWHGGDTAQFHKPREAATATRGALPVIR